MTTLKDLFAGLLLVIFFPICSWAEGVKLQPVEVEAPFPMDSVFLCIFPQRDFLITKYGAKAGGKKLNTKAIAKAITACHLVGDGSRNQNITDLHDHCGS